MIIIHRGAAADKRLKQAEVALLSHDVPMMVKRFDGRKIGPVVFFCAMFPLLNRDEDGDEKVMGIWSSLN